MGTFFGAYALVWLAVAAYVLRLGVRHRELREELQILEKQLDRLSAESRPPR